jgi:hypothetical protein
MIRGGKNKSNIGETNYTKRSKNGSERIKKNEDIVIDGKSSKNP